MRQDLSLGDWCIEILAELDEMQRGLREKMAPCAENPGKASVVQPPVRSVQVPSRKTPQQKNRTTITSSAVRLPVVTKAVKKTQAMSKVSMPNTPTPVLAQTHPLPSIVKARSSFWRERKAPALEAKRANEARQTKAAQTVKAYSKLSLEERLERAAQMEADYKAECQRLGM